MIILCLFPGLKSSLFRKIGINSMKYLVLPNTCGMASPPNNLQKFVTKLFPIEKNFPKMVSFIFSPMIFQNMIYYCYSKKSMLFQWLLRRKKQQALIED